MAKIITQVSFTDYGELESLGDLARYQLVIEGIDDEELMERMEKNRKNGRDDYPIRVMWNLMLAMKIFEHKTVASFRRELNRNSQLRKLCGLEDLKHKKHLVPPHRVFTNFIKFLEKEQEEVDRMFKALVLALAEELPEFGMNAAGDGKFLDSYAPNQQKKGNSKAGNRAEHDAKWATKEYVYIDKNGKLQVKKEHHFGFKANIICDVKTELPIGYNVLAANCDERKAMEDLLIDMDPAIRFRMEHLMLDRGYDSSGMIGTIKGYGIIPIVDIRNCWKDGDSTRQYKDTNMVYDYRGNVYWVDDDAKQYKMNYEGYDCQKKCLRYSWKGKIHKIYVSYDERVFLPVARDSKKFARLYKGRTAVERLNGRLDRDYMFEDHCIRGQKKMKLMVSLSLLIMNAMALGKIKRGTQDHLAALTRLPGAA